MLFILKFCKKESLIQLSREPLGQHLGEFQQRMLKLKFDMDSISLLINKILAQFNITLSHLIVLYFWVQGSIIQTT